MKRYIACVVKENQISLSFLSLIKGTHQDHSVMTSLPTLSSLDINDRNTGPVAAPPSNQIPDVEIFNIRKNESTRFDFEREGQYPLLFSERGAVFSCPNREIKVDWRPGAEWSFPMDYFFGQTDAQLEADAGDQGSFNYTRILHRDDVNDKPWMKKIHQYVESVKGRRVEKVAVRVSKFRMMQNMMITYDLDTLQSEGIYPNTNDRLFQELFLTLYAAQKGVGPDIYACQCRAVETDYNDDTYPRVVYLMEAGDADLSKACQSSFNEEHLNGGMLFRFNVTPKTEMDMQLPFELFNLIERASMANILILDIKPGNIIAFFDSFHIRRFTNLKLIDFGTDFATFVHGVDPQCIMFANCVMLALYVGSRHSEDRACMLPMMGSVYRYIKQEQRKNDGINPSNQANQAMCMQIQRVLFNTDGDNGKTLMDENGMPVRIVNMMVERAIHYALKDMGIETLVKFNPRNANFPRLLVPNRFDPRQPFLRQLIQNFLIQYETTNKMTADLYVRPPSAPRPAATPPTPRRNPTRGAGTPRRLDL